MKSGGLVLLTFSLVMLLMMGIALIELIIPMATKAKLDTLCASFSEQAALQQAFSEENESDLESALSEAGLMAIDITVETLSTLKRGDRALFSVSGTILGRRLMQWNDFETHVYPYQFKRAIVCRKILN